MKWISTLLTFSFLTIALCAQAAKDPRREMPTAFKRSYIGISVGRLDVPYTSADLENGLTAREIEIPRFAPRIFIGHFFNPYIAGQLSLMRPIDWVQFKGVQYPADCHSVWISLFGITARPTLPITRNLSVYGNIGLGLVSRHGFKINNHDAIKNKLMSTLLTGGGLTYAFGPRWHTELGFSYALQRRDVKQPHIFYIYTGFYYLLLPAKGWDDTIPEKDYIFPLNFIQAGFFTNKLFHENTNKYFSEGGYLPIFWDGKVKNRNGIYFMYERNFFHTARTFSLEWGASISRYQTHLDNQTYYAFSLFPELKIWIVRSKFVDFYFMYSLAGPTYITRDNLDRIDTGMHFIFQDLLGVGFFLGEKKHFNINVKIGHYSNGNIAPMNAGIEVPLTIAVGYAFG